MDADLSMLKGPYDVIVVDPPWKYSGDQHKMGAAANHYPTMTFKELTRMRDAIQELLAPKGVLFMWATGPKLDVAIRLLYRWELYYRGMGFVWVKTTKAGKPIGASGVRPSIIKPITEFVLMASKVKEGRPMKLYDESIVQTVFAPKPANHSEKPREVYDRIELLYPYARRIDMFARRQVSHVWESWGNELSEE